MKKDIDFYPEESVAKTVIKKYSNGQFISKEDVVSGEQPLEIILKWKELNLQKTISITMRTPGDDHYLALGFLFSEGIIQNMNQVEAISYPSNHKIKIYVSKDVNPEMDTLERNFYTTSSCGVCGKASIEALEIKAQCEITSVQKIDSEVILSLPEQLRKQQSLFSLTGGIHACALFDLQGNFLSMFEDVGRHNALDKLIGAALKDNQLPLNQHILLLSGRVSFEMMQKATMAGIPIIASIGAPSSLAVELAKNRNHVLIGFIKNNSFNVYSRADLMD